MAEIKKSTLLVGVAILAGLVAAVKFLIPTKSNAPIAPMTVSDSPADNAPQTKPVEAVAVPVETKSAEIQPMAAVPTSTKEVSATKSYKNPAGMDDVAFTLVMDGTGTIVDVKIGVLAVHDISKKRQAAFAEGLPTVVKGKKLSELTAIDRVGGSSLTTKAFNDSITELKAAL